MAARADLAFETVARLCARHGLTPCGVVAARRDPAVERAYRAWLAAGHHGWRRAATGRWPTLSATRRLKADPEALLPGCRTVLVVALGYYQTPGRRWTGREEEAAAANGAAQPDEAAANGLPAGAGDPAQPEAQAGRIAQYAWGRDYHKLLGARLRALARGLAERFPEHRFRAGVDATPLLETHYAVAAGVGFRGKHTLAINAAHGSWFFIGELLTTLAIEELPKPAPKRCGSGCTYCIDVCPTRAIVAPYQLDARRCISYLTIEHRGPVPEELRPAIGDWLFGCDLCQEVCPWTVRAQATPEPDLLTWRAGNSQALAPLLALRSHADLTARFAGSPLMRAGRDRLVRNACTVAGNRRARELLPQLRCLTQDPDRGVAEHARWAVARITAADQA